MWEFVMRNVRWVGSWGKLYQIPHSSKRHHILLCILAFPEMSLSFFTTIYYPLSLKHQLKVQCPLVRWVGPSIPIWVPFPVSFSMIALIHHTTLFVHFIHSFLWNVYWEPTIFSPELWVLFILWLLLLFSHLVMSSLWTLWIIAWQAPPAHRISQTRILEWVAISFCRGPSQPRDWTHISCIGKQSLYYWATNQAQILWYHDD